jgi:hypothetical protein
MALTASSYVLCVCTWQAEKSWSKERCCAVEGNDCNNHVSAAALRGYCTDRTASSDYLYRLSPGDERYEPTGDNTYYQTAAPTQWPAFGGLHIGYQSYPGAYGGPPGANGACYQGNTYRGSTNEACGSAGNWGHTDLEVWRRA